MQNQLGWLANELYGIADVKIEEGNAVITVDNDKLRLALEVRPSTITWMPDGFTILMITLAPKKMHKEYEYYISARSGDRDIPYIVAYDNGKIRQRQFQYITASLSDLKAIFLEAREGRIPKTIREIFNPVW